MHDLQPDIIGITESWAHSEVFDGELSLSGYDLFRKDRMLNRRGGGVLLYVRSHLCATQYTPVSKFPEQAWCRLTSSRNAETLVGVLYRTPSNDIYDGGNHDSLIELMDELSSGNKHFVVMGDFNYNFDRWPPLQSQGGLSLIHI